MENEISLIAAFAKNRVIGNKGQIPWSLPEDQARFKKLTMGGVVIMGRRTFDEIFAKLGKALPGRHTIVVSKSKNYADVGCETASGLANALEIAASKFTGKPVFICGGAQLYKEVLEMQPPVVSKLYLTEVDLAVEGDTYFPSFNIEDYELVSQEKLEGEIPAIFSILKTAASETLPPFGGNVSDAAVFGFLDKLGMTVEVDTLLNGYKLLQDKGRFMYGIDAVLLSAFAAPLIRKKDKVVDLGTGTGIIPLLLHSSSYAEKIYGVEVQPESAQLAKKSVALNGLEGDIEILEGDIKSIPEGKLIGKHSVEVVTSNPPYMISDHGRQCGTDAKSIARFEVMCTLEDVVAAADYLLKPHGTFFMIHRPFRLPEIFAAFARHGIEPKRMQLIYPFADKEPNIVLIEGRKNAQPRLEVEAPLVVREADGEYTQQVQKIYDSFRTPIQ